MNKDNKHFARVMLPMMKERLLEKTRSAIKTIIQTRTKDEAVDHIMEIFEYFINKQEESNG